MRRYYNSAKKYKNPTPTQRGRRVKYDIQELCLLPGNLAQWYQEREKEETKEPNGGSYAKEWEDYQEQLGKAMDQIRPLRKTKPELTEPSLVIRLEDWGTEQEIHQLEDAYMKRDALQQEIARQ